MWWLIAFPREWQWRIVTSRHVWMHAGYKTHIPPLNQMMCVCVCVCVCLYINRTRVIVGGASFRLLTSKLRQNAYGMGLCCCASFSGLHQSRCFGLPSLVDYGKIGNVGIVNRSGFDGGCWPDDDLCQGLASSCKCLWRFW